MPEGDSQARALTMSSFYLGGLHCLPRFMTEQLCVGRLVRVLSRPPHRTAGMGGARISRLAERQRGTTRAPQQRQRAAVYDVAPGWAP